MTLQEKYQKYLITDFNPHSRKGSDPKSSSDLRLKKISIHTPARGVTQARRQARKQAQISIHTPARGVTITNLQNSVTEYISIHTPARGVTKFRAHQHHIHIISIHTPARGVTSEPLFTLSSNGYFNPHSRKGSDCHLCISFLILYLFQSTLPQGE